MHVLQLIIVVTMNLPLIALFGLLVTTMSVTRNKAISLVAILLLAV